MTEDTQGQDPLRDHPPVSRNLIKNPISLIGLALSAVAFANIVLLVLIDVLSSQPSPYIGILAYMVAPGILVFGLVLMAVSSAGRKTRIPFAPSLSVGAVIAVFWGAHIAQSLFHAGS